MRDSLTQSQPDLPLEDSQMITFSYGDNWQRFGPELFSEEGVKSNRDNMFPIPPECRIQTAKYFIGVEAVAGFAPSPRYGAVPSTSEFRSRLYVGRYDEPSGSQKAPSFGA